MRNRIQSSLGQRLATPGEMEAAFPLDQFAGFRHRQFKAAIALLGLWIVTIGLHLLAWGSWIVYGFTAFVGLHLLRLLFVPLRTAPLPLPSTQRGEDPAVAAATPWPFVSILVAAKDERAVIGRLVNSLLRLDYPAHRFDIWMIDDHSTDGTAEVLDALALQHSQVQVIHRNEQARGGKSGALNEVWPQTTGEVIVVFDADAQVSPDLLRRVVALFQETQVGAVQVRKAIANSAVNFWTYGQTAEMAFDAYCQRQRVAAGGVGELRGNGQFVRREAIEVCGGWNEVTITDDLDLTFRLHLMGWDIPVVIFPTVEEEGVTQWRALWHQRNRWAEGGYQRYLDYWRLLLSGRLGWRKTWDLFCFWLIQYALPTMALPDLAMAVVRTRPPVLTPLSSLVATFLMVGLVRGLRLTRRESGLLTGLNALRGVVYMLHWMVVMPTVTLRMALRPKHLRWVKTNHLGLDASPWGEVGALPESEPVGGNS